MSFKSFSTAQTTSANAKPKDATADAKSVTATDAKPAAVPAPKP